MTSTKYSWSVKEEATFFVCFGGRVVRRSGKGFTEKMPSELHPDVGCLQRNVDRVTPHRDLTQEGHSGMRVHDILGKWLKEFGTCG